MDGGVNSCCNGGIACLSPNQAMVIMIITMLRILAILLLIILVISGILAMRTIHLIMTMILIK